MKEEQLIFKTWSLLKSHYLLNEIFLYLYTGV